MTTYDNLTQAKRLVYTSVQDAQSALPHYKAEDLPVLREALKLAEEFGHKTRCKFLRARIRKLEKES